MLQRAASNACTWWWASQIRTRQSKWLDNDLQEMEEKVQFMMKLIDVDADSFGRKAELYFKRRPELLNYVDEIYKAYKALADRYDRISAELHKANHTLASAFPDQIQFDMEEDYDEEGSSLKAITSIDPSKLRRPDDLTQLGLMNINKEDYHSRRILRHKRITSQISKEKAQEEIERLQKEILMLQTEKEFVRSSYQTSIRRYFEIEKDITEMQDDVCSLQDTFNASAIIEDDEARALMAATAMKSCEDSLINIQEQQKCSTEEAKIESERIKDAQRQLMVLKGESCEPDKETTHTSDENVDTNEKTDDLGVLKEEKMELQMMCQKVKEHFERSSESSVVELAEKIDELVDKVISLELTVSSQSAQIERLRSETDDLHGHLRSLEGDKIALVDTSNSLTKKLKEAKDELQRVQHLEKRVYDDKGLLQKQFIEACNNLNSLSAKLLSPIPLELQSEEFSVGSFKENSAVKATEDPTGKKAFDSRTNESYKLRDDIQQSEAAQTEKDLIDKLPTQVEEADDISDLQNLLNGLEGGDQVLLTKCTSIIRNYTETKKKLVDIERKNQEYHLETMAQVKELKDANAMKDEEIQLLKEILSSLQDNLRANTPRNMEKSRYEVVESPNKSSASFDSAETKSPLTENDILLGSANEPQTSAIQTKFRADIDTLLDENLDFWLRFCTSYHQIQNFQKIFKELKVDAEKLIETKSLDHKDAAGASIRNAQARELSPVDKRLRELSTEIQVWLEKNALLNGELKCRFASLCSIQDEITRVSKENDNKEERFTLYQAAKFQGELLNMQLEHNKVAKELQAGFDYVRGLQVDVGWTLSKLNKNYEITTTKGNQHQFRTLSSKARIPLRTFLFGAKPKKPSLFACMSPAMHKHYHHMGPNMPR
ncbi:protein NETWORKED 2A-like [Curcuma longa]|uniref:protein NETWORKED 2A-like n=1 Tax=Curcuma longa TaxID=136217 RepID=UPI003D9E67AD